MSYIDYISRTLIYIVAVQTFFSSQNIDMNPTCV